MTLFGNDDGAAGSDGEPGQLAAPGHTCEEHGHRGGLAGLPLAGQDGHAAGRQIPVPQSGGRAGGGRRKLAAPIARQGAKTRSLDSRGAPARLGRRWRKWGWMRWLRHGRPRRFRCTHPADFSGKGGVREMQAIQSPKRQDKSISIGVTLSKARGGCGNEKRPAVNC